MKTGKQLLLHVLRNELAIIASRDTHMPNVSAEMNKERADRKLGAIWAIENLISKVEASTIQHLSTDRNY